MSHMKASAIANANIALVKYWGKTDEKLHLAQNNSISMTTDGLTTHTTIEFSPKFSSNFLIINNRKYRESSNEFQKVNKFMDVVRELKKFPNFRIISKNNFPTGAGLASSASGFAALATAVNEALNLNLDEKELSVLARRGSGSASRSIPGGFVEWHKDSYAEQFADWPEFRMIVCITDKEEKKVKSRQGMQETVNTSPYYDCWLKTIEEDIQKIKKAILEKDFTTTGEIAEQNCLKMHALMWTTRPALIYQNDDTIRLIHAIRKIRQEAECYFTMDAGPQVKIMCLEKHIKKILKKINWKDVIVTKPGDGARVIDKHLK